MAINDTAGSRKSQVMQELETLANYLSELDERIAQLEKRYSTVMVNTTLTPVEASQGIEKMPDLVPLASELASMNHRLLGSISVITSISARCEL